jgi:hypothetical protein
VTTHQVEESSTLWASTTQSQTTNAGLFTLPFSAASSNAIDTGASTTQSQTTGVVAFTTTPFSNTMDGDNNIASETTTLPLISTTLLAESYITLPLEKETANEVTESPATFPTHLRSSSKRQSDAITTSSAVRANFGAVLISYYNRNVGVVLLAAMSLLALVFAISFRLVVRYILRRYVPQY